MTTCHAMIGANATNVVHIHYFLAQQEASRRLQAVERAIAAMEKKKEAEAQRGAGKSV